MLVLPRHRIRYHHWLPRRIVRHDAITLGHTIYTRLARPDFTRDLWAHEVSHVIDWARYGAFTFIVLYIGGLIRHGYQNHPMEVEARAWSAQFASDPAFDALPPE